MSKHVYLEFESFEYLHNLLISIVNYNRTKSEYKSNFNNQRFDFETKKKEQQLTKTNQPLITKISFFSS